MRNHTIVKIIFVVLAFSLAAGISDSPAQYDGSNSTVITMTRTRRFEPDAVTINPGDTVEWRNDSGLDHNVTTDPFGITSQDDVSSPPGAATFNSGAIIPGSRYMYTFVIPGTYRYVCVFHESEGMSGRVTVRQTPIR